MTHGIAKAGIDCWLPSSSTLLNAGLSPKRSQVAQDHAQLCLELLQRMHLQGWSFPSSRAVPLPQCIFFPLMFNQRFPCCKSQLLPPGLSIGGSIHSPARPQGVKGSNYPPPLPAPCAQLRLVSPLWWVCGTNCYSPPPQVILHLRHPKEPSDSGMHQKLPGLKILGSTFIFLTPRAFGYQNVGLCHLCCVIHRVLQSLGY